MQLCCCAVVCNMFACLWRDAGGAPDAADAADAEPEAAAVIAPVAVVAPAARRDRRGHRPGVVDSAAIKLAKSRGQLRRRKRLRWCLEGCFSHVSLTQPTGAHGILK